MRVALGPKDWAELKPVEELTRSDRKAVNATIVFEQHEGRPVVRASMDDDMAEAIIERVVTDWSLPLPLPSQDPYRPATATEPEHPGSLNRLSLELDEALRKAIQPHIKAILGQNAPAPGNEVPTPGSANLSGTSRGSLTTKIRSLGKWWATSLTRRNSAGPPSRSTSSPSNRTTGSCRSCTR